MFKRITFFLLITNLFIASCQTGQGTANVPTATMKTVFPSETPEAMPSATPIAGVATEPSQTELSAVSTVAPHCFTASTEGSAFAFMPDSIRILIKERSGVRIFNLETKEESFIEAPQDLMGTALSPDGEVLAWSLPDNTIQLIQVADGKLLKTLEGHTLPVLKLRFSSTGDRLFSASYDTWVRIWDRDGKLVDTFQPTAANDLPNEIDGFGVSPDGTKLGSIPFDGPAKVWNLTKKTELANLGGTGGDVTSDLAFSPDGKFVAADPLERLSLWRTSDWNVMWTGVHSLAFAFSPDAKFLAYSDADDNDNVILRTLAGTQETRTLKGYQTPIYDLFFSPDGTLLAAAGPKAQIWQVESGELSYIGKPTCP